MEMWVHRAVSVFFLFMEESTMIRLKLYLPVMGFSEFSTQVL